MYRFVLILWFCWSGALYAQTIGEVTPVMLNGGETTLTLDFSDRDYELILFPTHIDELGGETTYSYTVSGTVASAKPVFRPFHQALSGRDHFKAQLRAEERVLSEKIRARGGWQPKASKVQATQAETRTFVYVQFGSDQDRTVTAKRIYENDLAVAYLDDAAPSDAAIQEAEIRAMLDTFASETYGIVTGVFGEPSDVDQDGKVLFLFTPLVDAEDGVAGFYRAGSLFTVDEGGDGNVADMMYIGLNHEPGFFKSLLAHEFQHLINFNQHVLVHNGLSEESWLDEGLAHYAEDLVDEHIGGGMKEFYAPYLSSPESYSLVADASGSNGVRGGAYLFVRGLVEEFGAGMPGQLVKTGLAGINNVESATGRNFADLFESHAARLFLSGTKLNASPIYTYDNPFLTEPSTGKRTLPSPFETGVSATGTPVTGKVQALAPVFMRLMGEATASVQVQTEIQGNFRGALIALPKAFRTEQAVKADYFTGITFDAPLQGVYETGKPVKISGTISYEKTTELLLQFVSNETGDAIQFFFPVSGGRFERSIVFHDEQVGDQYTLELFFGDSEEGLPFAGDFSFVNIVQGSGPFLFPVDYFSGIVLDAPMPATLLPGTVVSGRMSDGTLTEVLFRFEPKSGVGDTIRTYVDVVNGRFAYEVDVTPEQFGTYNLVIFAGKQGESLSYLDQFSPIVLGESGSVVVQPPPDHSGTPGGIETIDLGDRLVDSLLTGTDAGVYRLVLSQDANVKVQVIPQVELDLVFAVYNGAESGDLVDANKIIEVDDSVADELILLELSAGSYLIRVTAFDGQGAGPFVLAVSDATPPLVQVGEHLTDTLTTSSDMGIYRLVLEQDVEVTLNAIPNNGMDLVLVVYQGTALGDLIQDNQVVVVDETFEGETVSLTLSAGSYLIQVATFFGESPGAFVLELIGETTDVVSPEPPDSTQTPPLVGLPEGSRGPIALDLDVALGDQKVVQAPAKAGDVVTVDVVMVAAESGLNGFNVVLTFDPAVLSYEGFSTSDVFAGGIAIENKDGLADGQVGLNVAFFGTTTTSKTDGTMGQAVFRVLDGFQNETRVSIASAQIATGSVPAEVTVSSGGLFVVIGGTVSASVIPDDPVAASDLDGDGSVGFSDFLTFASAFGKKSDDASFNARVDLNQDGEVNFPDFLTFAQNFGKSVGD